MSVWQADLAVCSTVRRFYASQTRQKLFRLANGFESRTSRYTFTPSAVAECLRAMSFRRDPLELAPLVDVNSQPEHSGGGRWELCQSTFTWRLVLLLWRSPGRPQRSDPQLKEELAGRYFVVSTKQEIGTISIGRRDVSC